MKIGDELTRKGEIYHCLISRIIKGSQFEIARHHKSSITCDCSLLDKSLAFLITARRSLLAAKISCCREIQKVYI